MLWGLAFVQPVQAIQPAQTMQAAQAQTQAQAQAAAPLTTRVEQHLFLDESNALDFSAARAATYKTFNPLERLPLEGKAAWLRLTITRADNDRGPLTFRVLPPIFDKIVMHTPVEGRPGEWQATGLGSMTAARVITAENSVTSGQLYLQINSAINSSLLVIAGNPQEVAQRNHHLDILITAITTLCGLIWIFMLWQTARNFSWLSMAIVIFLPATVARFWIYFVYANSLLGIPAGLVSQLFVPSIIALVFLAACIFQILALELFNSPRSISWLWGFVLLLLGNWALSFFNASAAIKINDVVFPLGCGLLAASLVYSAIRSPQYLRFWPAKLALATLLLTAFVTIALAFQLKGLSTYSSPIESFDVLVETIFMRSTVPIVFMLVASWVFEKVRTSRLDQMHSDLKNSNQSLELESKRLDRQRKFTAMLSHELKNPLTASHMALSGIEERLDISDPMHKRTEKIKTSLQEINDIIDRCSEMDGYEQGQMPMTVSSFSVRQLLASVKAANPSERIYTMVRSVNEDDTLTSDLHYIKIILNNLLTNALKYAAPDSLVELEICSQTTDHGKAIEFTVSNEIGAAGVPDPKRLFERFYRAEAARNQSGAGLGLWLSQSLAHALSSQVVFTANDGKVSCRFALQLS